MIRIAIQNKGRLSDESTELLNHAGVFFDNAKRKYLVKSRSFPAEVLYLRDDDIPATVESGAARLGIVGLNEVAESGADVRVVKKLGFGFCRLCLAIPKNEEYTGPEYFNGKRVATSYPKVLKRYFEEKGIKATIMFISGSVEITPSAGMADAIFDIVSSGGTLVSNGLKEVETVMESEAVLIANRRLSAEDTELADELLARIESVCISRDKKYILMNIPTDRLPEAIRILPAMRSPTVIPLAAEGWCSLHSVVAAGDLWEKVRLLKQIGAEGILVLNVDKIIL
ncbi:MAG: ATP phosphoribosyltransferase [Muribaculaceae bacterium]|nr:ATP phosphoribosyltransferase [Muribaculaceae bacterium]